jgi:hypothetical protein
MKTKGIGRTRNKSILLHLIGFWLKNQKHPLEKKQPLQKCFCKNYLYIGH